ncbi:MAG: transcription elongation factor GreA [Lachnospiraceae bacterium]|nr:transcription elongation factor GreA [Lachnospiraceae bacterium]
MEEKKNLMTYEELQDLENELQDLKVNKRREIAEKIKEAREQGDLSENAEYDAAKDEQRDIEARIEQIEDILKHAEVVLDEEGDEDKVNIGSKVKILALAQNAEMTFKIVGPTGTDSLHGKISHESPVGRALLGTTVGDVIKVETEAGEFEYKVLEIIKK